MQPDLAGILPADMPIGTIALSVALALGAALVGLGLLGGRFVAVIGRAALVVALVGAGAYAVATYLPESTAPAASTQRRAATEPAVREPPRIGLGHREVVAYMDGGSFFVSGRVNGIGMDFIVDTGATAVVLTAEDAARMGWGANRLDYSVVVSTANGSTRAAPITLERLAVEGIEERDVRALVAQPGALRKNLLGMTYLSRLASYEVRGDRLLLRGR